MLSCGRDVTSPGARDRVARGLAWRTQFPAAYQQAGTAAAGIVDFAKVRVLLHHADGTVAIDTTVDFTPTTDSLPLTLDVKLLPSAPASGEPLDLDLAYINAAGDTVFKGGPVSVLAVPAILGKPATTPVTIPVAYTGPGATAVGVQISPRAATASSGTSFPFTAVAVDGSGNPVPGTPVFWSSLDTTYATVPSPASGTVLAVGNVRTTARITAQLLTGNATDQVILNVQPPATTIAVQSGSGQTGAVGAALANPLVVYATAGDGGPAAGVMVTFTVTGGGGYVASTSVMTNAVGLAQTAWTLGYTAGAQTLTAGVGTLSGSPLTFSATATSTSPPYLFVTTSPASSQVAGTTITPGFAVYAYDANNNPVPSFTGTVTLAIGNNPGGSTLSGTTSVSAVGGIATFNAFSLNKVGTGYTVVASTAGYASGTSTAFNVTAGAATTIAISGGNNQSGPASAQLAQPLSVIATDAGGNPVAGVTVHFAVTGGGGSVGTAAPVTNASGLATTTWTLGATGAQSVGATALNALGQALAGSPLAFTATGTGAVASTTVTPHTATIISLGDVTTLVATSHDASNNVVSGTYGWVSRTPGVATVSATTGVVTGVTNGTAYVVATELGGTKDSALVTVAQSVATINVTPNNRNIYLTGNFTFTAQAVDGRGVPLAAQPTFTWSSSAPAIASVNSSTGVATGVFIGAAQIKATAGSITGVSNVNILSAIQHIYVVRDSAGFSTTASDTFNMAALQLHRAYKAFAYDTLNNPVNGLTFTWTTTNPSVASIDTTAALRADALSVANGNTSIQASVQGVTGAALLNVQQVLKTIAITPVSPTIAVNGSVALTARGKDSNGQFIAGGTFTWSSATPANVTVDPATGVAKGVVAPGSSNITATSGAITSAVDLVTVSASVPPIISFGRDTVAVGRGSNTQVPILLSTPSATPVVVNLAVADTFAFWSSASVTIPAGQTSINAQLNGHNAGTTQVTAADAGAVYATATSVLAVQANMHLASGGYALNATDQQTTQVLLSDPSPVGGTFVTFNYGTAGVASVSPSPAFIPAGQLAATIVITGVAAGTTTITPVAIGVNGTPSSFTTYASTLTFSTLNDRLGAGQFDAGNYVYLQTYTVNPLVVSFASSDTTIATVTQATTIAPGNNVAVMTLTAKAPGTVTITASAPGWSSPNHLTLQVTTPQVTICCGTSLNTTSPAQTFLVEAADSVGTAHDRTSSLVVHVSSTNPAVLTVIDSVVTIAPGIYYNNTPRVIPGGTGGTAMLIATAGGHIPDTSSTYTVAGPKLTFSWSNNHLGVGQEDDNVYVFSPNNVLTPLTITLSGDTTITGIPATVTIPTGTNIAYFNVRGKALGSVPIIATAAGYQSDTATYTVTTPKVKLFGGGSMNNFAGPTAFTVEAYDSTGTAHNRTAPLAITFTSSDTTVVTVDPTVTIAGGIYYANTQHVTPVGTGTALIIASAPGHTSDTLTYTVVTPPLNLAFSTYTIGALEHRNPTDFYAYTPNLRATPLAITLTDNHPATVALSATTLTINAGTNIGYFTFAGLAPGIDTVTATAPGYLPTVAYIRVTTPMLTGGGLPSSVTTTNPPITVTIETADSVGSAHYASDTVIVHAVSSNPSVLQPTQAYFPILKDNYFGQSTINVVGPGSASITYSDSAGIGFLPVTSNTMTVTGPSLSMSTTSFALGNRQNLGTNGIYVYTPNAVASPLVVSLTSTDPTVAVPSVSSVTIPIGSNIAYFNVNALDATGTIQIQATATGYGGVSTNVQVTAPKFVIFTGSTANTTSLPQAITVEAYDNSASPQAHYTNEDVTIALGSSASSVAATDSATVTIPAGNYYHNTAHWIPGGVGTTQLTATDPRPQAYHYNTASATLTVNTPTLTLNNFNQLGIGQYSDNYFYVQAPDNAVSPITVTLTHPGTVRTTTPATVTIPTNNSFSYIRVIGAVTGTDTLVASATSPLFNSATAFMTVGNGRLDPLSGWPGSSMHVGDSVAVTIFPRDPAQTTRNVLASTTFTLAPDSHLEFHSAGAVITTATIPADGTSVTIYLKAILQGSGSASISATNYTTYVNSVTVIP